MCSLSVYCIHHLVSMKLGSPAFKAFPKILAKNGDWLNENLSRETIFLATALHTVSIG